MKIYCKVCRKLKLEIPKFTPHNLDIFLITFFCYTCKCFRLIEININKGVVV